MHCSPSLRCLVPTEGPLPASAELPAVFRPGPRELKVCSCRLFSLHSQEAPLQGLLADANSREFKYFQSLARIQAAEACVTASEFPILEVSSLRHYSSSLLRSAERVGG